MKENKQDLREDLLNVIDSVFAEYNNPECSHLIESIKGVFQSSEDYNFPKLEKQIKDAVEFHYSEGEPRREDIETKVQAVFLSWRYKYRQE